MAVVETDEDASGAGQARGSRQILQSVSVVLRAEHRFESGNMLKLNVFWKRGCGELLAGSNSSFEAWREESSSRDRDSALSRLCVRS